MGELVSRPHLDRLDPRVASQVRQAPLEVVRGAPLGVRAGTAGSMRDELLDLGQRVHGGAVCPPVAGVECRRRPFPTRGETLRPTRSNLPYLIAAAGGVVLFISLFLSWVSGFGGSASAWDSFSGVDLILALLALTAVAIGAAAIAEVELPLPALRPELLKWLGVIAVTIVLSYVIELDNADFGAFLAVVAGAAILAGGVLAERPDLAGRLASATGVPDDTRPAASPPTGIGGSASSATAASRPAPPRPPAPRPAGPSQPSSPVAQPATSESPTAVQPAAGSSAGGVPAGAEPAAAAQPAQSSGPPAGWYPDPQGQARLRYWDGNAWTDQTSG